MPARNSEGRSAFWAGSGEPGRHARQYEIELTHYMADTGIRVRTVDFDNPQRESGELFEEAVQKIAGSDAVVAEMSGHDPNTVSIASRASVMRKPVLALFDDSPRHPVLPPMVEGDPNVLPYHYERNLAGIILAKMAVDEFFAALAEGGPYRDYAQDEFRTRVARRAGQAY